MQIFSLLGLAATLLLSTSSVVSAKKHIDLSNGSTQYIPGRYIVEFSGTDVQNDAKKLIDSIKKEFKNAKLSVADSFAHELFNGVSIQVDHVGEAVTASSSGITAMSEDNNNNGLGDIIESIISQAHVSGVYPVRIIPRPNLVPMVANSGNGTDYSKLIPHAMTQVDKVHKELKNTGKDIVVGIIDSGVDYYHPALGGGFGPGYKVAYGYDLVGDDYSSESGNPPVPGPTPLDNCGAASGASGHGTHVSGIVAGKADNFTGVAPDATLGMWRVFGCNGSTGDDIIMKAMMDAYDAGVDIISMSLGDNSGWSEAPSAVLGERIAKKGTPVVVAASNSGAYGAETLGSPSTGHGVLSVASVDNDYYLVQYFTSSASSTKYEYQISSPSVGDMPAAEVAAGDKAVGSSSDACEASNVPSDVKGKIALVKRGSCTFDTKSANVAKAGAIGLLVYNSEADQAFTPSTPGSKIPVAGVSTSTGEAILDQIKSGKSVTLNFNPVAQVAKQPTGNTVSSFSSVGPTFENDLKPEIAGIGGFVYSTLPRYLGSWGVMSGTSMATPYVSGSIALYLKSLDGEKKSPSFISEQFENYALQLLHENGASGIDSPLRQGAGLVQVYDTILQGGHVSPGKISFNDTNTKDYIRHTLTVKNYGKTTATYNVVNNVSMALVPYDVEKTGYEYIEPAGFSSAVTANLKFSKTKFVLKPGASTKVTVTVTPPKSDPSKHIMYGGFIQFQSKQVKDISVPYFGIVGKQHELPLFNDDLTFVADAGLTTAYGYNDTFVYKRSDNNTQPVIVYSVYTGTAHITAELYTEKGKRLGLAMTGLDYVPRNSGEYPYSILPWDGTYTPTLFDIPLPFTLKAPKGTYRIKWTGLRLLGNPKDKKDLETWESCLIKIE